MDSLNTWHLFQYDQNCLKSIFPTKFHQDFWTDVLYMLSIFCNISPGWRGIRNLKKLIGSPQATWCWQHLLGAAEPLLLALQPHLQLPQLLVLLLAAVFRLLALCRHLNPEEPLVLTFNLTETSATCRLSWMQSSRFCTRTRNAWSWEGWQSGNPTTPRWAGRRSEPGRNMNVVFTFAEYCSDYKQFSSLDIPVQKSAF